MEKWGEGGMADGGGAGEGGITHSGGGDGERGMWCGAVWVGSDGQSGVRVVDDAGGGDEGKR